MVMVNVSWMRTSVQLCGFILLCSQLVLADGFRNPPHGPSGFNRIGGKAYTGDPSAIWHNPANLLESGAATVSYGSTLLYTPTDFDPPQGRDETSRDNFHVLPYFYATFPIADRDMAAGIGIMTPFGQSTTWDKDGNFQYVSPYFAEMRLININPTFAMKVAPALYVGAGVDVYISELELRQMLPTGPAIPDGRMRFDAEGSGVGYNVGMTWRISERHRLGLTYRSAVSVDYDGDFRLDSNPSPSTIASRSDFDSTIDFPDIIGLGYGVECSDQLRIEIDVEWVGHSTLEDIPLELGNNLNDAPSPGGPGIAVPASIPQNWNDNWAFGVSADWQRTDVLLMRFGYHFVESPIDDTHLLPTLPDLDRHVFSVGVEYTRGHHSIFAAYSYLIGTGRDVDNNQQPAFNGAYDSHSQMVGLSYEYDF